METPWWAKRIPAQLDLPWALNDMAAYIHNPSMLKILYIKVDEAHLASKGLDGLPDMTKLVEAVKQLHEASTNG